MRAAECQHIVALIYSGNHLENIHFMIIIYSALGFFVLRLVLRFPEKKFVFSGNLKLQSSER